MFGITCVNPTALQSKKINHDFPSERERLVSGGNFVFESIAVEEFWDDSVQLSYRAPQLFMGQIQPQLLVTQRCLLHCFGCTGSTVAH